MLSSWKARNRTLLSPMRINKVSFAIMKIIGSHCDVLEICSGNTIIPHANKCMCELLLIFVCVYVYAVQDELG
jgi:hypothetical protein